MGGKNNHDYIHVLSCQQIKLINKKKTSKCGELVGKKSFDKGKREGERAMRPWDGKNDQHTTHMHENVKGE